MCVFISAYTICQALIRHRPRPTVYTTQLMLLTAAAMSLYYFITFSLPACDIFVRAKLRFQIVKLTPEIDRPGNVCSVASALSSFRAAKIPLALKFNWPLAYI